MPSTAHPRRPAKPSHRPHSFRPRLESLEVRDLMSVYVVNTLTDTGAGVGRIGDLRYCLTHAADGDTITFTPAANGTINLAGALPDLSHSIKIKGPGAGKLTVRRDGGGNYSVFTVDSPATVSISGLTVLNGYSPGGGGGVLNRGTATLTNVIVATNSAMAEGGGVANYGTLTVTKSVITANLILGLSSAEGGGIYNAGTLVVDRSVVLGNGTDVARFQRGGGIESVGTLVVNESSVLGNTLRTGSNGSGTGGGIDASGQVTITNSTVANNTATTTGGGLAVTDATAVLSNSTVAGNSVTGANGTGGGVAAVRAMLAITNSTVAGNAIDSTGSGGGVSVGTGAVTMSDTIVAGNSAPLGPDLYGELTTSGYNLVGDPTDAAGFADTDLLGVDPQLGPLQGNGGRTSTMAPACGSPAIDAGDPDFQEPPDTDQRGAGYSRVVNEVVDIGAYEVQDGACGAAPRAGLVVGHTAGPDATPALVLAGQVRTADATPAPVPVRAGRTTAVAALDRLFASLGAGGDRLALSPPTHRARAADPAPALTLMGDEWPLLAYSPVEAV